MFRIAENSTDVRFAPIAVIGLAAFTKGGGEDLTIPFLCRRAAPAYRRLLSFVHRKSEACRRALFVQK